MFHDLLTCKRATERERGKKERGWESEKKDGGALLQNSNQIIMYVTVLTPTNGTSLKRITVFFHSGPVTRGLGYER